MMIQQQCIIDLLEKYNVIATYIDCHSIGTSAVYHFGPGKPTLMFEDSCIPIVVVRNSLAKFELIDRINEVQVDDCLCG